MKALIYETLVNLANQDPEQHATIRQNLYEQLDLPFDKQLALYAGALGPASSGKLENHEAISNAVDSVVQLLEIPEHRSLPRPQRLLSPRAVLAIVT